MACCSGAGQCRCRVSAEADDGCNPVGVQLSGSGTDAAPFVVGTTWNPERAFRTDGNEPWQVGTEGGCSVLVPRQYRLHESRVMCDASGVHVGYAFAILDVDAGTEVVRYQALDTTTVQNSLPSGWTFCCPQSAAEVHAMCTAAAVEGDPDDLVGYAMLRYDVESDTYQQQYVTVAGSITTTLPANWIPCGCGAADAAGGDPDVDLTENFISISIPLALPSTANLTLTNMAAAEDFLDTSIRFGTLLDLTDWEEARLVVRKMGTAGATGAEIRVEYSTVNPGSAFVGGDWLPLGTSDIEVAIDVQNTVLASSWIAITALARDDVYVAPTMQGGDGALDPIIGQVSLQLRRQVVTDVAVTGGGGGGGGPATEVPAVFSLTLPMNEVIEGQRYPNFGIPGLADNDRVEIIRLPPGFTTGTWTRLAVTLHNVTGVTTEDVVVVLRNVTDAVDVATLTIASGTSPSSNRIIDEVAIGAGTIADEDALQWYISGAADDNAYALRADAFYELS